jgi:vacuolar-type H+-ATPase subunit I/STV1
VKDKGNVINIPGIAPFRTPAEINITNVKLPIVIATLHNCGITDFEIVSKKEDKVKKETDNITIKQNGKVQLNKNDNINERFKRIEKSLSKLITEKDSKKSLSEEQITKKLAILEELSKKILERELVKQVVYTSVKENINNPIEELDEEIYIPDVDISDLKIKGSSSQTVGEVDNVEEAADILSRLKK